MGYVTVFDVLDSPDPILRLAAHVVAVAGVLIVTLIVAIIGLRVARLTYEWRARRLARDWRPLLAQCAMGAPRAFPQVRRRDRFVFLEQWNHHYELLRGEAQRNLRLLAGGVNIAPFVQGLVHSISMRNRLIGVTTLGHLGGPSAIPELTRLTQHCAAPLSFAAARALLEIDAHAQLPRLLLLIARRRDWPLSRIALALRDLGADHFSLPLANAVLVASERAELTAGLPRLLHLMELAHTTAVMPAVDQLLRRADTLDDDVIASCLRLLNDPRQAYWARTYATHGTWYVRVCAANALLRIGSSEDFDRLMHLLGDTYWWVRYRAGQALARLPGITPEAMMQMAAKQKDKFAADMLRQVAAETRLAGAA